MYWMLHCSKRPLSNSQVKVIVQEGSYVETLLLLMLIIADFPDMPCAFINICVVLKSLISGDWQDCNVIRLIRRLPKDVSKLPSVRQLIKRLFVYFFTILVS